MRLQDVFRVSVGQHVGLADVGKLVQLWEDEAGQVSELLKQIASQPDSVVPSSLWDAVVALGVIRDAQLLL